MAAPSKFDDINKNGVDFAVNSMDPNWDQVIKSSFPEGVDIALDFTSGANFLRTQQIVKDLGRAILIGKFRFHWFPSHIIIIRFNY